MKIKFIVSTFFTTFIISTFISLFAISLKVIIKIHEKNLYLIFFLPCIGIFTYYLYKKINLKSKNGTLQIIKSFKTEESIPIQMSFLSPIGALLSHLFGATVGREGIALQIGTSLSIKIQNIFSRDNDKKFFIMLGICVGFSSMFGTPLAAIVFSFEFLQQKKIKIFHFILLVINSFLSIYFVSFYNISHQKYNVEYFTQINIQNIFTLILLSIILGLSSRFFVLTFHFLKKNTKKIFEEKRRIFIGGIFLIILTFIFSLFRPFGYFSSLGLNLINDSFYQDVTIFDGIIKAIFTIFSISFGFIGGEVTPLFAIGASIGSSFTNFFSNFPKSLGASLGYATLFAICANAPLTGILIGIEIFGIEISPYLIFTICLAYFIGGKKHIYME